MRLFVVPCKYSAERPLILECVERIRLHHPIDDIVVVDSASDDKRYFDEVMKTGAMVADVGNLHYATGAHAWAFQRMFYDHYVMLADSVWLNAPLPMADKPMFVRWFDSQRHNWGIDRNGVDLGIWGGQQLADMGVAVPPQYDGILGPYVWGPRQVFDELDTIGYFDHLPADKWEQCALERVAGILLAHLGYDVRGHTLQGEHVGHFDAYDETIVTKLNPGRM